MKNNNPTYIWTKPTRIFHILLILGIIITWISADDDFMRIHSAVGYGVGILIIYRFVWGIIGPKYSNFRDFNFSLKKAIDFSKGVLTNKEEYLGHNPASSLVLFLLLIVIFVVVFTGVLALSEEETKGLFSSYSNSFLLKIGIFEDLHELTANLMLAVIFMHLSGVALHKLLHSDKTETSIFTGYKNIKGENIKINIFQSVISFIFLLITFYVIFITLFTKSILY